MNPELTVAVPSNAPGVPDAVATLCSAPAALRSVTPAALVANATPILLVLSKRNVIVSPTTTLSAAG